MEQFCTINVLYALVEMQDFRCSILHKGLPSLETSCWCSSLAEIRHCVCTPFTRPYIDLCWAKVLFFNPYLPKSWPKSCWILEALLSDVLLVDQGETTFESLCFDLIEDFIVKAFRSVADVKRSPSDTKSKAMLSETTESILGEGWDFHLRNWL